MPLPTVPPQKGPSILRGLRGLAPETPREALEFASDLSPVIGFLVFSDSPGKVLLPLAVELIFLEAFVYLRILSHALWRLKEGARELLGYNTPHGPDFSLSKIPFILFFGAIGLLASLALVGVILAFNKVPFLIAEGYMGTALARDPNLTLFHFIGRLPDTERSVVLVLCLVAARRYIIRSWTFFRNKNFQAANWSWLVLGLPELPTQERMSRPFRELLEGWDHFAERKPADTGEQSGWLRTSILTVALIPVSLTLFPGSLFIPLLFFSSSLGPAWMILAKAFIELWFERAYGPIDSTRSNF